MSKNISNGAEYDEKLSNAFDARKIAINETGEIVLFVDEESIEFISVEVLKDLLREDDNSDRLMDLIDRIKRIREKCTDCLDTIVGFK